MPKQQMASTRTFKTTTEIEASANQPTKKTKSSSKAKVSAKQLPWIIVIILALFSVFMYSQYLSAKHTVQNPSAAVNKQVASTINSVSKLAVVPTNETPTVETVQNATKLKSLAFYKNAENGDKVIVYTKAGEAILYRPSTNQIVNILAVTVSK